MVVNVYCSEYFTLNHASSVIIHADNQIFRPLGVRDIRFEGLMTIGLVLDQSIRPPAKSDALPKRLGR